jgi:O-antigen/teichoic acid export membrane protein
MKTVNGVPSKPGVNLRNTAAINIATMAMNVGASVICARMLGPLGRGAFSVIQLWPITAAGLGTLGLPRAMAYYMGKRHYPEANLVTTGAIVLLISAALSAAALYTFMPWLTASQPQSVSRYARWCIVLLPLLYLGCVPYYVLQGLNRLPAWNIVRLQFPVLWIAMHFAGYLMGRRDLTFYVCGYLAVAGLHNLTWLMVFIAHFKILGKVQATVARRLFRYGLPLTLSSMPQFLNLRLDQVLMAAFVPPRILGLYVTAVAWSGLIMPALTALSQVLFPMILELTDGHRQYELLGRSLRLSTLCAAVCAGGLILLTPIAIPLIYGRAFADASVPACLLALGSVFLSMNNVLSEGFRALGLPKYPMYAEIAGFGVTGILLTVLLPRWPLVGASIASLISYGVTTTVLVTCAARTGATTVCGLVVPRSADILVLRRVVRQFVPITHRTMEN